MPIEVDYITLGEASNRIDVPAPTLRHWTDQLEEFNVHYVPRNNRNERIYEESDIAIFTYLRDLKAEYKRRTTTKDLGYMIAEKGNKGELKLRTREDAPPPEPSNRTSELMNNEDMKKLMESDKAKQFFNYAMTRFQEEIKDDFKREMKTNLDETRDEIKDYIDEFEKKILEKLQEKADESADKELKLKEKALKEKEEEIERLRKEQEEKDRELEQLKSQQNEKKGFFSKFFG